MNFTMSFLWRAIYFVDSFYNISILTGAFASISLVWICPCLLLSTFQNMMSLGELLINFLSSLHVCMAEKFNLYFCRCTPSIFTIAKLSIRKPGYSSVLISFHYILS